MQQIERLSATVIRYASEGNLDIIYSGPGFSPTQVLLHSRRFERAVSGLQNNPKTCGGGDLRIWNNYPVRSCGPGNPGNPAALKGMEPGSTAERDATVSLKPD